MNAATCPHCKNIIASVTLEPVAVNSALGLPPANYHGVSYSCPQCRSILSVAIDPVSLLNDTITGVVDRLRKG